MTGPLTLSFSFNDAAAEFAVAFKSLSIPVSKAATIAITHAGDVLKEEGRAMIRAAGFSSKWEHAYRVTVYPRKGKTSIDAAAFGVFKGIPYSDIFGIGGQISGKPLLWIPFDGTPKLDRRKTAADVRDYKHKGIELVSFKSKAGRPMLAVPVLMSAAQARSTRKIKLSAGDVESGSKKFRGKRNQPGMVIRAVPVFFGVPNITIKKRFEWKTLEARVQARVPGYYEEAINELADK